LLIEIRMVGRISVASGSWKFWSETIPWRIHSLVWTGMPSRRPSGACEYTPFSHSTYCTPTHN